MKLDSLTQWFTLIANIGVLVGIVFLAYELQQNNELLEAEIRTIRHEVRSSDYLLPLAHPEFANALIKHRHGEDLSEYETLILERSMANTLYNYQYVYVEYTLGRINEESLPMDVWRHDLDGDHGNSRGYWPDMRAYWDANKIDFDPGFVQWIETNVIGR